MRIGDHKKELAGGAIIAAFIGLGAAIPALGLFLGPFFKFGGGVVGGALGAYLIAEGARSGARAGAVIGFAGGILSGLIGFSLGTLLNAALMAGGEGSGGAGGALLLGIIGLFTGWIFVVIGAVSAGATVGWLFADTSEEEDPATQVRPRG